MEEEIRRKKGFSLVELILTVLILAVAIPGTITMLGGMARQSGVLERHTLATSYARMRMEQILSKRFDESLGTLATCTFTPRTSLGFDAGESASNFDDVDDLNNWNGEISTDPFSGKGLRTRVIVEYVTPGSGAFGNLAPCTSPCNSTCFKRITVEVTDFRLPSRLLARVRSMATPYK